MATQIRIFVSSPGDVREERIRAQLVIAKLSRDYASRAEIKPYFWESEPLRASAHFQDEIDPPSNHDIVVLILWSRLGTPLPIQTTVREYKGIDGRSPVTGTEWEFEDALSSFRSKQTPDLMVYRRQGDPGSSLNDLALRAEQEAQWYSLEKFWERYFENKGEFISSCVKYESLEIFDRRLEQDLSKLIERRIAASEQVTGNFQLKIAPYRGLSSYEFEDHSVFFGRDNAIKTGILRLSEAAAHGCGFLMVLGSSGAGKSSLARAGLLPTLVSAKALPSVGLWRRVTMRPGDAGADPIAALADALLTGDRTRGEGLAELGGPGMGSNELATHLRASAADASYPIRTALNTLAEQDRRNKSLLEHEEARLVLLVDQLEELFTRPEISDADQLTFIRLLAGLCRSGVVWVITTMRSDLWHHVAAIQDLLDLTEEGARLDLQAPTSAELIEVIRRPARATGLSFEENDERLGLDAVLAEAANAEPGALPLLSVVLEDLYRRDITEKSSRQFSFASYMAIGELKGAIATRAESAWQDLSNLDAKAAEALPEILRAIVTISSGDTIAARPTSLDQFPPSSAPGRLIAKFIDPAIRLLVVDEQSGNRTLRLAHEALILHWPRAYSQIALDRRDIETYGRLEIFLKRFESVQGSKERSRSLLTGLPLEEGIDLVKRWNISDRERLGKYISISARAYSRHRLLRQTSVSATAILLSALFSFVLWQYFLISQNESEIKIRNLEIKRRTTELQLQKEISEKNETEAKRQENEAIIQSKKANQQFAIRSISSAKAMSNNGMINQALLMLDRSASFFSSDDVPDELMISLTSTITTALNTITLELPENILPITTREWFGFFDPKSKSISSIKDNKIEKQIDLQDMAYPAQMRQDYSLPQIYIVFLDGKVAIFDMANKKLNFRGKLNFQSFKNLDNLQISPDGIFSITEPVADNIHAVALNAANGNSYDVILPNKDWAFSRGKSGFIVASQKYDVTNSTEFFELRDRDRNKINSYPFKKLISGISYCLDTASALQKTALMRVYNKEDYNSVVNASCKRYSEDIIATTNVATSSGDRRDDTIVFSDGKTINIPEKMDKIFPGVLSPSYDVEPAFNPNNSQIAVVVNKTVYVFDEENSISKFSLVLEPSSVSFDGNDRIAAYLPGINSVVVRKVGDDINPFANKIEDDLSINQSNIQTSSLFHKGNCVGTGYIHDVHLELADGALLEYSTEMPQKIFVTKDTNKSQIDLPSGENTCFEVSPDQSKLLIIDGIKIAIYDFGQMVGSSFSTIHGSSEIKHSNAASASFKNNKEIIVSDNSNVVRSYRMDDDGVWSSTSAYVSEFPVYYSESSPDQKKLVILESTAAAGKRSSVVSIEARDIWYRVGDNYKYISSAFLNSGSVIGGDGSSWEIEYKFPSFNALIERERSVLSPVCRYMQNTDVTKSKCWPEGYR